MKVKNLSSVITNSSDEVFVYRNNTVDPKELLEKLRHILGPDHPCSGMGGILEVERTPDFSEDFTYKKSYSGFPDGYLLVVVDYGYLKDLRDYLLDTLGEPLPEEELSKLFLQKFRKDYEECSKSLLQVNSVTQDSLRIFREWRWNRRLLESSGESPKDTLPTNQLKLFLDWHQNELYSAEENLMMLEGKVKELTKIVKELKEIIK